MQTTLDRFLAKTTPGPMPTEWTGKPEDKTECLLWTAAKDGKGYGQFYFKGKKVPSHRYIYEICIKSIPSGMFLDHLCRIRNCVNPLHVEPVTNQENLLRSPLSKTHAQKMGKTFGRARGLSSRKDNLPEGVCYSSNRKKFTVRKRAGKKNLHLGTFDTVEEASKVFQNFINKGES